MNNYRKKNKLDISHIKAAVFDLDGTLIDTERIYRKIWPINMANLGYEFGDDKYLMLRSLGRPYAPAKFKEWYGEDFDYDGARRARKVLFDDYVNQHGIQLKKGAIELLTFLRSQKILTAIATATDLSRANEYIKLTGLTDYFDRVISATIVDEGKPSPKVYQYACRELGFEPSQCMAVEDAPNGIISAYRAGCQVIMVPDQSEPEENIIPMLTACVDDLSQIIDLLN